MAKKTNVQINGVDYYRVRKTVGKDKNGEPIVKPFYGRTKKEAEQKRDEWVRASSMGLKISDNQSLTMSMHTWLWNIEKVSGNKLSTFERYEGIYRNYIENTELGYMIQNSIDKLILQRHYNKLFADGKTYSQIKNLNKLLNKYFEYCVSEGYLDRNPCAGIKFNSYKGDEEIEDDEEDEGKVETFSDSEIKILINDIPNKKLRILVKFALATGLRQGEILALKQPDIKDMVVSVTKTLKSVRVYDDEETYHYELKITKPKTKKSKRKVPIPSELKKDLAELNKIRNMEKLKLGELYKDNDLLFPSATGEYIDSRNLIRSWKRALERVGVEYKKFHTLRHTYATQLIKNGVQLITVSRLLGHASIQTTEIYAHVLESTKKDDVESLNAIFN